MNIARESPPLPAPSPGRFKPLRCGLVELFLYEAQEFHFHDGRLLLRGDNGSGKSKVLALTLPLLLDADLSPARVEPDADPNKRMAWNLLLGDEHDERTGYSWVEFGRVDEQGSPRFVTLGLGMKAVRDRGVVRKWWFITHQRIGDELHLVDRARTVRSRERLIEAIADDGNVYDTAEGYRRRVDEELFGLHARYASLVDLLVHLRQPQLSKRPDEKQLARALSESLPPMPESLIDTVAQSYQALEDDEREIRALEALVAAVNRFDKEYVRYARDATSHATIEPRQAQSGYENQNRQVRAATVRRETAAQTLATATEAAAQAKTELARLGAEQRALRDRRESDALRQLDDARRLAASTAKYLATATGRLTAATAALGGAQRRAADQSAQVEKDRRLVDDARSTLAECAATAGIHLPLDHLGEPGQTLTGSLGETCTREVTRRRSHVESIERLVERRNGAETARNEAQRHHDEASSRLDSADEQMQTAQQEASDCAARWLEESREHLGRTWPILQPDGEEVALDDLLEAAAGWAASPEQTPNPLRAGIDHAAHLRDAGFADRQATLRTEQHRHEEQIAALDAEIAGLQAGVILRPVPPRCRTAERDDTRGAAFWECVDVRKDTPPQTAAALEAALEAAGIVDAWITTDATVRSPDGDVLLRALPQPGPTIADLLDAVPVRGVDADTISEVLRSIALVEDPRPGQIAVSVTGAFALGPLVGAWHKPESEYLGQTARERARRVRIAAAGAERDDLHEECLRLDELWTQAQLARDQIEGIRSGLPDDEPVRRAAGKSEWTAQLRARAQVELSERDHRLVSARSEYESAVTTLRRQEEDCQLPESTLDAVRACLAALPGLVNALVTAAERMQLDELRSAEFAAEALSCTKAVEAAESDRQAAAEEDLEAQKRHSTLEAALGEQAHDIDARLAALESETTIAEGRARRCEDAEKQAVREDGAAVEAQASAERDAEAAAAVREEATAGFRRFVSTGLFALALPDLEFASPDSPWAPDPTVRLARRAFEELGGRAVEDSELDRAVNRLRPAFETLQTALSAQAHRTTWDQRHGAVIVSVQYGRDFVTPDALGAELSAELDGRQRLLTAKERDILETHLIDEVGSQLHEHVREAIGQVERINDELEHRPTRSGLRLRIRWQPGEDELDRKGWPLLQQNVAAWSPEDRGAIGEYLRERIGQAREEDPEGNWHERLRRAFDYREWSRFSVQLHQNGAWRPASGPASGGERVLAASVPLFAAAASYYGSADNPWAPRLILLDEAFAGVDDRSRASYLGLLAEFDLDVVMTSEREWATYPEVPGIAIANLFRLPGMAAIHVEHWVWNGNDRHRVEAPGQSALEPSPAPGWDENTLDLGGQE